MEYKEAGSFNQNFIEQDPRRHLILGLMAEAYFKKIWLKKNKKFK